MAPMEVFKLGEAKDQGGHLGFTANAILFTEPDRVRRLRSVFPAEEVGAQSWTIDPAQVIACVDRQIQVLAPATADDQTFLEDLVAVRACAVRANPAHEFGISYT